MTPLPSSTPTGKHRPFSIRARLLLSVGAILLVAGVSGALLLVHIVRQHTYASFDALLGEHAQEVMAELELPDEPGDRISLRQAALSLPRRDWFWLSANGQVLGQQAVPSLPPAEAALLSPAAPVALPSRRVVTFPSAGVRYRVLIVRERVAADPNATEGPAFYDTILAYGAPVNHVEEHIRDIARSAALACLLMLAACLAATWLAVDFGLRPLQRLAERAAAIDDRQGEFAQTGDRAEVAELAPLTGALTLLVGRLRQALERERQFFGDAAHELKTGVAILKSTVQLGLRRERRPEEYLGYLSRALTDTERLQDLVARMLALAAIDADAASTIPAPIAAANVKLELTALLETLASFAEERKIAVQCAVPEGLAVRVRAEDFRTIFSNLLENAIRYSERGGAVELRAFAQDGTCLIEVRDSGIGIPPDALPHIFERFWRGDASRARSSGGFGLGLSIARGLARRAGGDITATSEPAHGSTFTVILPLASA